MNLNLGSGADKRDGWVSVDGNPDYTPHVLHDLRQLPLPFKTATVGLIYMEMALSQLSPDRGQALLLDCYRMLKPGGRIRIHEYDFAEWEKRWILATGKFRYKTRAERHYEWSRSYGWQLIYDRRTMVKYLTLAGFSEIVEVVCGKSDTRALRDLEKRKHGFVVEARKNA